MNTFYFNGITSLFHHSSFKVKPCGITPANPNLLNLLTFPLKSTFANKESYILPDLTPFGIDISYTWIFLIFEMAVIANTRFVLKLDTDLHTGGILYIWHSTDDGSVRATRKEEPQQTV